jgi:hypothetical protein
MYAVAGRRLWFDGTLAAASLSKRVGRRLNASASTSEAWRGTMRQSEGGRKGETAACVNL